MTRDFRPLYTGGNVCLVCGALIANANLGLHAAEHLASGEAVCQLDYRKTPPTEQVVPTDSLPVTSDIWENDHDSFTHKDTNSENERRARVELAATRRRIARAAKEAK